MTAKVGLLNAVGATWKLTFCQVTAEITSSQGKLP